MKKTDNSVIMTASEYESMVEEKKLLESRIDTLRKAVMVLKGATKPEDKAGDIRLHLSDFLYMYDSELNRLPDSDDPEDRAICGNDVIVSWWGFSCNCGDGAVACNNIIEGIRDVLDENGDDYI